MPFDFRIRFDTSKNKRLGIKEPELVLHQNNSGRIVLKSIQAEKDIENSTEFAVIGSNYLSEEMANEQGERVIDILRTAFTTLRFPVNFGDRTVQRSWYTAYGLELISPPGKKVFNDRYGLQVFESVNEVAFAKLNADAYVSVGIEKIKEVFSISFEKPIKFDETKRLAFELFSASMFSIYADSKFLLLMMALETMIIQNPSNNDEVALIQKLIEIVNASDLLTKDAFIARISNLKRESVGAACRRLVSRLTEQYGELSPKKFFDKCYKVRSSLVHGHVPRPSIHDVGNLVGPLEVFITDLISLPTE